jgi:hypothetical protein
MPSQIDPTKPADGVPAEKADLRANLAAAKSELEGLQAGLMVTEVVSTDKRYTVNELQVPIWIQAYPENGPITITLPDPGDLGLPEARARLLAIVRATSNAHDVRLDCAAQRLRSQAGTDGWSVSTQPVALGVSLAAQQETVVAVWMHRNVGDVARISVVGHVREVSS